MRRFTSFSRAAAALAFLTVLLSFPFPANAHCDTMDGPVIADAKIALERGDITPVLKWVKEENEKELRDVFLKTVAVRGKGDDAHELADRYFFETLVRLHRVGEGEPFTGLKPAGSVDPAVAEADKAIERGSIKDLSADLAAETTAGVHERFARVLEARKKMNQSVKAGREYVAVYVELMHYLEAVHMLAAEKGMLHGGMHGEHAR